MRPDLNVFVYGSLKRGFRNHHFMAGSKFVGCGVTAPVFAMLDLGRFPGVVRGDERVAGEVYAVPAHAMGRIDRLEDNGRLYQREVTRITTKSGSVDAWIYVFLPVRRSAKLVRPRYGIVAWQESRVRVG